jgi:hypothetical protein
MRCRPRDAAPTKGLSAEKVTSINKYGGCHLRIFLGGIKTVDALAIQLGSNMNSGLLAATDFIIEKRNLDLSWTTIVTGSAFSGSGDIERLLALDLDTAAVTDQLRITLPGTSASWRTIGEVMVFNEVAVPEPASLGILSLGALMLARRRR